MVGFVDEFLDMMSDEVVVTPGFVDGFGKFIASGEVETYPCRIEGQNVTVRDDAGREVKSSVQIIVGDAPTLTTRLHRYTLPIRYLPNEKRVAVAIERESDENGPDYEIVYLP